MPENYDDFDQREELDDRGDDGRERVIRRAKQSVLGPAIGLIIVAIIGILLGAYNLAAMPNLDAEFDKAIKQNEGDANKSAAQKKEFKDIIDKMRAPMKTGLPIVMGLGLVVGLITLLAAVRMMSLKGKGLIYLGSILSMIPCTSGCCILGIPFGIWAIIVLGRPEVRAGFAAVARGER